MRRPAHLLLDIALLLILAAAVTLLVLHFTTKRSPMFAPPALSYGSAISYTQRRAPFTPRRTVRVASASQLKAAISSLQPGDLVKATANFTVPGETIIKNRLSGPAVIDLTGHTVRFVYQGTSEFPAVWVANASRLRIYGGDLSTSDTGGSCLSVTGSQHVTWWRFRAHDCGGTGFALFTLKAGANGAGPSRYNDFQGQTWKFGQHRVWDPHQEKCTGIHGANLADGNYLPFDHNRIALYVHDSNCEGAGIEFGSSQAKPLPTHNVIYLKCVNLSFVSTIQTGGNCYQAWGYGVRYTDIRYLEADNLTGHPYWAGGMYSAAGSAALLTDQVEYGHATNVRLNPRYAKDPNWDPKGGTAFVDVTPLR